MDFKAFLFFGLGIIAIILVVVLLKYLLRIRVEDKNYSSEDDYLKRRMKDNDEDK